MTAGHVAMTAGPYLAITAFSKTFGSLVIT